jgi:uncharacterized protein
MNTKAALTAFLVAGTLVGCQPAAVPTAPTNTAAGAAEASTEPVAPTPPAEASSPTAVEPDEASVEPPPAPTEASSGHATALAVPADGSAEGSANSPSVPVLFASDLASLRAHHVVSNEGASCGNDDDCQSPLRCIDAACAFPPAMTGFRTESSPRVSFTTSEGTFEYVVELAMTSPQQQRGLMHRRTMVADAGMIFVFPDERPRSFWMRNTLIPLDMVFVRTDGIVDSFITGAQPLTEVPRPSEGPARFVIELNAGETVTMGLRPGDRVTMQNVPQ